jgi:hypothetical protein
MLILLDQGTPKGLARALSGHTVATAQSRGWDRLSNGALLNAAEQAGFDLLLSTDQGIRYQQNLAGRKIALVVLTGATKWSRVRLHFPLITAVLNAVTPGSYTEIPIPQLTMLRPAGRMSAIQRQRRTGTSLPFGERRVPCVNSKFNQSPQKAHSDDHIFFAIQRKEDNPTKAHQRNNHQRQPHSTMTLLFNTSFT